MIFLWSKKISHWAHTSPPASSVTLAVHSFLLCRHAISSDFVNQLNGLHFCMKRRHSTCDWAEIRISQTQKPVKSWYFLRFTCHHCQKLAWVLSWVHLGQCSAAVGCRGCVFCIWSWSVQSGRLSVEIRIFQCCFNICLYTTTQNPSSWSQQTESSQTSQGLQMLSPIPYMPLVYSYMI